MIVTVTGYKGGIGKTTTALHLAAYLQRQAPAVLVDGDLNRSATGWGRNGSLPFRVVDERQAAKVSREFEHIVIDTAARPVREDLEALVAGCDHLIIPTTPSFQPPRMRWLWMPWSRRLGRWRRSARRTIACC